MKRFLALALGATSIAALVYGVLLFLEFEGFNNSSATISGELTRHRQIEFVIFVGTACVPLLLYSLWRLRLRRRR